MKIIFIDVDGTLTDSELNFPQSAADAIKKSRAAGNKVYLCTGRHRDGITEAVWNIGLDGFLGDNGTYIESDGEILFQSEKNPDLNKATAVRFMLDHLGKTSDDAISFGDSKYDLPMFECCKVNVAMGNGSDEIKAVATFVTDSIFDDGIYHAFEKLNLF